MFPARLCVYQIISDFKSSLSCFQLLYVFMSHGSVTPYFWRNYPITEYEDYKLHSLRLPVKVCVSQSDNYKTYVTVLRFSVSFSARHLLLGYRLAEYKKK